MTISPSGGELDRWDNGWTPQPMATLRRRPDRRSGEQRNGKLVHCVIRRLRDLAAVASFGDRSRSIPLPNDLNPDSIRGAAPESGRAVSGQLQP